MKKIFSCGPLAFAALLITLSLACAPSVTAQTTNVRAEGATLAGRVTDPQDAGVAGAVVTLYARELRVRLTALADETGAYRFARLAEGDYLVEADALMFRRLGSLIQS